MYKNKAFKLLVREVANSFPYSHVDSKEYASRLQHACLIEYRKEMLKAEESLLGDYK